MDDLAFLSALETGALLRERQLSPVEAVEGALRRIEALDPAFGAFAAVDGERALGDARGIAADDRRAFAGVPIALKANVPAEGLVMDFGTRLLAGHRAGHDAYVVRRLREEGFVIVGTTRLPELGALPTTEPAGSDPARNPYDPSRTPGGSSGGSAAAVASGMVPIAHGNDGGGSIRIPAACCGLVGLKPSRGRVSRGPDQGDSFLVIDGTLTRTVLDTAAALDVLAGYEVGDATWAPRPAEPFTAALASEPRRLRVAVTTASPLGHPLHPENERPVREAAELLAGLGHEVTEPALDLPGPETLELFLTVFAANVALGALYAQALAGRPAGDGDFEPMSRAMVERAAATPAAGLLAAQSLLQRRARDVVAAWADFDVLLTPALAARPPAIGELHGALDPPLSAFERAAEFAPYAGLFNVTGQPALSLPWDLGSDGLPTAVQLVGCPLGEDTLLALAAQIEQAHPWEHLRPPAPAATSSAPTSEAP